MTDDVPAAKSILGAALACAVRVVKLLVARQLHLRRDRLGAEVSIPDGRRFIVFRDTSRDGPEPLQPVTLAVWFRLRGVPPGARIRRWLFERESILNTILFAGFDGYLVKLWMVDPHTSDYAGLYTWASAEEAERYAEYITGVLRPLSTSGSLGYKVVTDHTLDEYFTR